MKPWPAFVLLLALLSSGTVCAQVRGQGDFEFSFDRAVFLDRKGGMQLEVYVRIPNSELKFKPSGRVWEAKVALALAVKDSSGKVVAGERKEMRFEEADEEMISSPIRFSTVVLRYPIRPGAYTLSCRVEDLQAPKLTLLAMIKKRKKSSSVSGVALNVPSPRAPGLGGPEFLWEVRRGPAGPVLVPNPPRVYGLYLDTLLVYYQIYLPDSISLGREGRSPTLEIMILDDGGEVVKRASYAIFDRTRLGPALQVGGLVAYSVLVKEDLTEFPVGRYALYARLPGLTAVKRAGFFSVAWEIRSWEALRRDLLAEARFLLEDDEYESFKEITRGEQEKILEERWKVLDPDPSTGINEAYEEFQQRLRYVNEHYSDYDLGAFTDRGLIYLRYGPPDEVVRDVMPLNRETTSDALAKLKDKYEAVIFSTHGGRISAHSGARDIIVDRREIGRVGEGGNVAQPYELWIYDGKGRPLLERDKGLPPDIGLRFIFVDREGYGRYKLEVSSSLLDED